MVCLLIQQTSDLPPGLVYWHLQCNNSKWNVSPSELNPFSSCIPRPWNDKVLVTDNSLAPRPSDLTSHKVASISSPAQWDSGTALHLPVACRSKPPSSFMWTASTASSLSLPSPLVEVRPSHQSIFSGFLFGYHFLSSCAAMGDGAFFTRFCIFPSQKLDFCVLLTTLPLANSTPPLSSSRGQCCPRPRCGLLPPLPITF